jgi:hypothetical protein
MAAGEDKAEAIILDLLWLRPFVDARFEVEREVPLCGVKACPAAYPVNGLEACG